MGNWTKTFVAILALLGGTVFVVALTTPGIHLCGPTGNTPAFLGFSCDAWLQSVASVLAGAATLAAVVLTLRQMRLQEETIQYREEARHRQDVDIRRRKLAAIGHELREARRQIKVAHKKVRSIRAVASVGASDTISLRYADIEEAVTRHPLVQLTIYPAVGYEIAHMSPEAAQRTIEAESLIRKWNNQFSTLPQQVNGSTRQRLVQELDRFDDHSKEAVDACTKAMDAIANFTGLKLDF